MYAIGYRQDSPKPKNYKNFKESIVMKKRITVVLFALLLVCTVCFSIAACGDKSDTDCKHTYGKWVNVKEALTAYKSTMQGLLDEGRDFIG